MPQLVIEWADKEEEEDHWIRGIVLFEIVDQSYLVFAQSKNHSQRVIELNLIDFIFSLKLGNLFLTDKL